MSLNNAKFVDVFPITTSAFGFPADWFETYAAKLVEPSYVLMVLLLVIAIGVMALKRFEDVDFESKLWNIPITILAIMYWPVLILGLKGLVDSFNTFLVKDIFQIPWAGFGFPKVTDATSVVGWSAEGIARLLPNFAYWIVYAFYVVLFFFFAALGPFLLAKGVLFDEIDALLDLVKEVTLLFLWQSTVIILVAFIMPEIVSGKPLPPDAEDNFYFLSVILGVMLLFVPSLTRKFASHVGAGPSPHGIRLRNILFGMTAASWGGSAGLAAAGFQPSGKMMSTFHGVKHWALMPVEVAQRRRARNYVDRLERENYVMSHEISRIQDELGEAEGPADQDEMMEMLKRARREMEKGDEWA